MQLVAVHTTSVRNSTSGRGPTCEMTSAAANEPNWPHSMSDWPLVMPCRNPEAYRSPAPVVSITLRTGTAGTSISSSAVTMTEPLGSHGDRRQLAVAAQLGDGLLERVRLVEGDQLSFVAEQQIDLIADERQEVVTMAIDAERVGKRQRHHPAGCVGDGGSVTKGRLGLVAVVQVSLHVQHFACRDRWIVEIIDRQQTGCPEVGVHGALGVGGDHDDAAPSRHVVVMVTRPKLHADGE